jgi:hypothetical protein
MAFVFLGTACRPSGVPESFLSVPVGVMRGELRRVASACTGDLGACLQAAYNAASAAAGAGTGQTVSATAANAHSVSFSEPGKGSASPQSWMEMWSAILDLFYSVSAGLPDGATDADILAEMLFQLQPAKTYRNDYSCLRTV